MYFLLHETYDSVVWVLDCVCCSRRNPDTAPATAALIIVIFSSFEFAAILDAHAHSQVIVT